MSRQRLFGTDGMRGTVNQWPMTVDAALAWPGGRPLQERQSQSTGLSQAGTRLSGYMFRSALTAAVRGRHACDHDRPLPTPAISFLTRNMRADLGL